MHESCDAMKVAAAPFCSPSFEHAEDDDAVSTCGAVKTADACGAAIYTGLSTCSWSTYACDWSGDEYGDWANEGDDYCSSVGEPCCNAGWLGNDLTWLGGGVVVDPDTCFSAGTNRTNCKSTIFAEQCQGAVSECKDVAPEEACDAAEILSEENCVWKEPLQTVLATLGSFCCTQCGTTFGPKVARDYRDFDCAGKGLMAVADPTTPCGSAGPSCTTAECCVPDPDLTTCADYGNAQLSTNCCTAITKFMEKYADSDGKMNPADLSSDQPVCYSPSPF